MQVLFKHPLESWRRWLSLQSAGACAGSAQSWVTAPFHACLLVLLPHFSFCFHAFFFFFFSCDHSSHGRYSILVAKGSCSCTAVLPPECIRCTFHVAGGPKSFVPLRQQTLRLCRLPWLVYEPFFHCLSGR